MIRPKARPMLIQTVDSIAASLIEMTCAVRCTSSRSTTSIATIDAMSANQTQTGTAKLAKFPAWAAGARTDGATRSIIGERGQRGGTIAGASRSPVTLSGGGPRWTGPVRARWIERDAAQQLVHEGDDGDADDVDHDAHQVSSAPPSAAATTIASRTRRRPMAASTTAPPRNTSETRVTDCSS